MSTTSIAHPGLKKINIESIRIFVSQYVSYGEVISEHDKNIQREKFGDCWRQRDSSA